MARIRLDESLVQSLQCEEGVKHWEAVDTLVPGLYVDVLSSGRLTYRLRYLLNGRRKTTTLGNARVLKLDEARERATKILRAVLSGENEGQLPLESGEITIATFFVLNTCRM